MKNTVVGIAIFGCTAFFASVLSAATVGEVCVRQMWPWNAKVRIDYTLAGEVGESSDISVKVRDVAGNELVPLGSSFSGDLLEVLPGERVIWWDPAASGLELGNGQLSFTLEAMSDPQRYCVIDLSVTNEYKVTYHENPPEGGWNTDEYKTKKIVLRHVRPGKFLMGTPENENGRRAETSGNHVKDMDLHEVTLTKDYWLAIFPLTLEQASIVHGAAFGVTGTYKAYQTAASPAVKISFSDMLGWPDNDEWLSSPTALEGSWLYKLNAGIVEGELPEGARLCLPTEAQWEYACRAGTVSAYGNGTDSIEGIGPVLMNSKPMYPVGGFEPNAWGFYNMHGCIWQWTIDRYSSYNTGTAPLVDPYYPMQFDDNYWPALRGGQYGTTAVESTDNRSGSRYYKTYSVHESYLGVRIAIIKAP